MMYPLPVYPLTPVPTPFPVSSSVPMLQETVLSFLTAGTPEERAEFVGLLTYFDGGYNSAEALGAMASVLNPQEVALSSSGAHNRLYYLATPPSVFLEAAETIKAAGMSTTGW